MIIEHFDFDPGKDSVADATTVLCLENSFDPIVDYLDSLDWDGTPRLETWLTTYAGVDDTPLNRAIGRLTLVAAVRRVRSPGVKFDQIMVLEGPEGTNKSTLIAVLADGAAAISLSISRSVRCSRGRSSLFGRRNGVTVRFSFAGDTSLRFVFVM
jgi:predicted P-loop ATPase